jgi:hypothetical protein
MDSVVTDMLERGTSTAMQAVLANMDMTAPTADPSGRSRSTTAPRLTAANTVAVAEVEARVVAKVEEAKVDSACLRPNFRRTSLTRQKEAVR